MIDSRSEPPGWFSTLILSLPGHLCCQRPGWTSHWQATSDTSEFCRISTACADLDNVFVQKPGLSFKQSIILPAYQFPQDGEEGKKKKQNYSAFCSSISTWGLAVGTSEQRLQSPGSLTGAQGKQGERWGGNHKIWKDFPGNWHQCDLFNPDPGSTIWK